MLMAVLRAIKYFLRSLMTMAVLLVNKYFLRSSMLMLQILSLATSARAGRLWLLFILYLVLFLIICFLFRYFLYHLLRAVRVCFCVTLAGPSLTARFVRGGVRRVVEDLQWEVKHTRVALGATQLSTSAFADVDSVKKK